MATFGRFWQLLPPILPTIVNLFQLLSNFVNYHNVTMHPCQQSCLLVILLSSHLVLLSICKIVNLSSFQPGSFSISQIVIMSCLWVCQLVSLSAFSLRILERASLFKSKSTLSQSGSKGPPPLVLNIYVADFSKVLLKSA